MRADRLLTCRPHPNPLPEGEGTDRSQLSYSRLPLWDELLELHHRRRDEIRTKFSRSLPLADELVDRWERARFLGFGEGASVYDSALVIGDVKVGRETWIGPQCVIDGSAAWRSAAIRASPQASTSIPTTRSTGPCRAARPLPPPPDADRRRLLHRPPRGHCGRRTNRQPLPRRGLALVKTDLPDGSVAVGCPARVMGSVEVGVDGQVTSTTDNRELQESLLRPERAQGKP